MLNLHDLAPSLVPDISEKAVIQLVIGHIAHDDLGKTRIPLRECETSGVELYHAGHLFAYGELTMKGTSGTVEITKLIRKI